MTTIVLHSDTEMRAERRGFAWFAGFFTKRALEPLERDSVRDSGEWPETYPTAL